jgi:hypothetical protein
MQKKSAHGKSRCKGMPHPLINPTKSQEGGCEVGLLRRRNQITPVIPKSPTDGMPNKGGDIQIYLTKVIIEFNFSHTKVKMHFNFSKV